MPMRTLNIRTAAFMQLTTYKSDVGAPNALALGHGKHLAGTLGTV
ncbi:MAG: hypothetical protein WBY44_31100 [Bryobacteraceae bacterium]